MKPVVSELPDLISLCERGILYCTFYEYVTAEALLSSAIGIAVTPSAVLCSVPAPSCLSVHHHLFPLHAHCATAISMGVMNIEQSWGEVDLQSSHVDEETETCVAVRGVLEPLPTSEVL
jgi:hypothetical protein